jgi:hypothetical protein
MAQKKKLVKVNTQLPADLLAQLKSHVDSEGAKMQTVFAEAVRMYLKARAA